MRYLGLESLQRFSTALRSSEVLLFVRCSHVLVAEEDLQSQFNFFLRIRHTLVACRKGFVAFLLEEKCYSRKRDRKETLNLNIIFLNQFYEGLCVHVDIVLYFTLLMHSAAQ